MHSVYELNGVAGQFRQVESALSYSCRPSLLADACCTEISLLRTLIWSWVGNINTYMYLMQTRLVGFVPLVSVFQEVL